MLSTFKALHSGEKLFVLPNAWDAGSALLFQKNDFPAVGTSSAAVAASLGYEDGEKMSFDEYLFVIKRILTAVKIPLTVDIEMGYGDIIVNVKQLTDLGVAGINIEDSVMQNGVRTLGDAGDFAKKIENIRRHTSLFLNVRCDTYLLNVQDKQKETTSRLKIYGSAGADGIFLPCIADKNDITAAVADTKLPLNVMCIPGLPDFDTLNALGVKRASMGPFLYHKAYGKISEAVQQLYKDNNFSAIL